MVYKFIGYLAPKYVYNLLNQNSSRDIITLRNSELDLYVPFMNTKNGQKSSAPSLFAFKRAIKQNCKRNPFWNL